MPIFSDVNEYKLCFKCAPNWIVTILLISQGQGIKTWSNNKKRFKVKDLESNSRVHNLLLVLYLPSELPASATPWCTCFLCFLARLHGEGPSLASLGVLWVSLCCELSACDYIRQAFILRQPTILQMNMI